ncbi:GxxExxY protein [bacterium]|nr:GxxExxY protein [bacterium]
MKQKLLYETLSYEVRGCAIEVRKNYGPGHKESLYQNAYAEELASQNISFKKEEPIKIYSPKTGKVIGSYRPDFIMTTRFACLVY